MDQSEEGTSPSRRKAFAALALSLIAGVLLLKFSSGSGAAVLGLSGSGAAVLGLRGFPAPPSSNVHAESSLPDPSKPYKKIFISYGSGGYERSRDRLLAEAQRTGGFDSVQGYGREDLDEAFIASAAQVLAEGRGGGYWLWKSYILLKTMEAAADGDVIMYADAGCTFVGDPTPYLELAHSYGWLLFRLDVLVARFTKGDLFVAMDMPMEVWGSQRQMVGGIFAVQNSGRNRAIVRQWLQWGSQYQLISDSPSESLNDPSFQEHRHDQAILTLLAYKHGLAIVLEDATWPQDKAKVIYAARLSDNPVPVP